MADHDNTAFDCVARNPKLTPEVVKYLLEQNVRGALPTLYTFLKLRQEDNDTLAMEVVDTFIASGISLADMKYNPIALCTMYKRISK